MKSVNRSNKFISFAIILFFALPILFTGLRTELIANSSNLTNFNIAKHVEKFDLLNQIILAVLTIPIHAMLKDEYRKPRFNDSVKNGFIISSGTYILFATLIAILTPEIIKTTQISSEQIRPIQTYFYMEIIAFTISYVQTYAMAIFAIISESRYIIAIIIAKTIMTIYHDASFIQQIGAHGIALGNILVNAIISAACYRIIKNHLSC